MTTSKLSRKDRIQEERAFYTGPSTSRLRRFVDSNILFYHPERHAFTYDLGYSALSRVLREKGCNADSRVVDVACGVGHDLRYLVTLKANIVGIDVARPALEQLRVSVPAVEGDVRSLPFKNDSFDFVVVSLFLHHVVDEDFDGYLQEFVRVLKPGGWLVALDFSIFFPFIWVTRFLQRIIVSLRHHLKYERAFNPLRLQRAMAKNGLENIGVQAASYIHNRFYLVFSRIIARYQKYICNNHILKYCGFLILMYGQKATKNSKRENLNSDG